MTSKINPDHCCNDSLCKFKGPFSKVFLLSVWNESTNSVNYRYKLQLEDHFLNVNINETSKVDIQHFI